FVAGHALADLAPQAEAFRQVERHESAGFEAELHLGQLRADVLRLAGAFKVQRWTELETSRPDQREAKALIRRSEFERGVAARAAEFEHGPGGVRVGARRAGIDRRDHGTPDPRS